MSSPVCHSLDYIAVDFPGTVATDKVTNQAEYAGQMEFSQRLLNAIPALPAQAFSGHGVAALQGGLDTGSAPCRVSSCSG